MENIEKWRYLQCNGGTALGTCGCPEHECWSWSPGWHQGRLLGGGDIWAEFWRTHEPAKEALTGGKLCSRKVGAHWNLLWSLKCLCLDLPLGRFLIYLVLRTTQVLVFIQIPDWSYICSQQWEPLRQAEETECSQVAKLPSFGEAIRTYLLLEEDINQQKRSERNIDPMRRRKSICELKRATITPKVMGPHLRDLSKATLDLRLFFLLLW